MYTLYNYSEFHEQYYYIGGKIYDKIKKKIGIILKIDKNYLNSNTLLIKVEINNKIKWYTQETFKSVSFIH